MAQKPNSLFDPERRKAVRDAIRQGKDIFADRGKREAPAAADGLPVAIGQALPKASFVYRSDPPLFRIGSHDYSADEYLLLAIQYDDLDAAKNAVLQGANVNHEVLVFPVSPDNGATHPTRLGDPSVKSPLQYAQKLGKAEVAKFLKKNGATE